MNKIVAKCESRAIDVIGLHKTLDFIMEQVQNCAEIIIQSVFGFMLSDCPWTMYIKKVNDKYNISISSMDWQMFVVDTDDSFRYCWESYENKTVTEFYEVASFNALDLKESNLSFTQLKQCIFNYFCEDYEPENIFDKLKYYQNIEKDFGCYVIWKRDVVQ